MKKLYQRTTLNRKRKKEKEKKEDYFPEGSDKKQMNLERQGQFFPHNYVYITKILKQQYKRSITDVMTPLAAQTRMVWTQKVQNLRVRIQTT